MKRIIFFLLFSAFLSLQLSAQMMSDSAVMGNGYANDVYFDFGLEAEFTADRGEWDIAFSTDVMSISVLANDGAGIEVYAYNKGNATESWLNIDTTGMERKMLYNSDTSWEYGAFVRNIIPGDQFDYGWGRYNINNHKITGDSVFVMKLQDESWIQFRIVEKNAPANAWVFKYANLDGSNEQEVNLEANEFSELNFIGFSFESGEFIEHEPLKTAWDIQFTKYMAPVFMGPTPVPYPVTGVLAAPGTRMIAVRESGMDQAGFETYNENDFMANRAGIGYDWKATEGMPPVYVMIDTVMYFVEDAEGSVFKIYFTNFESGLSGDGKIWFNYKKLHDASSINDMAQLNVFEVFPNPAMDKLSLVLDADNAGKIRVELLNLNGQVVISKDVYVNSLMKHEIDISTLSPAVYVLQITAEDGSSMSKKVVHR